MMKTMKKGRRIMRNKRIIFLSYMPLRIEDQYRKKSSSDCEKKANVSVANSQVISVGNVPTFVGSKILDVTGDDNPTLQNIKPEPFIAGPIDSRASKNKPSSCTYHYYQLVTHNYNEY